MSILSVIGDLRTKRLKIPPVGQANAGLKVKPTVGEEYDWKTIVPLMHRRRADGESFEEISKALGVPKKLLIYQHNTELRRNRRKTHKDFMTMQKANTPEDTRNVTQKFCGDPLPGRSALDKLSQS